MRLAVAGYGFVGIAGIATAALWLAFRPLRAERPPPRHALAERLEPIAAEDDSWLGTYRLYTETEQLVLEPGGVSWGSTGKCNCDPEYHCYYGHLDEFVPEPGTWVRRGAFVRVQNPETPARELELGRLDGEPVLLGQFNVWRRVADAPATSSSR